MVRPLLLGLVALALSACAGQMPQELLVTTSSSEGSQLAQAAIAGGDPSVAVRFYADRLRNAPDSVEARLGLADAQMALGDLAGARATLEDGTAQTPEMSGRLGRIALRQRQFPDATRHFEAVLAENPGSIPARNGLAVVADMSGDHGTAQRLYRGLLEQHPENQGVRNNLGLSLILDGKPREAINVLIDLAAIPTAPPQTLQNLAMAYAMIGRRDAAAQILEASLSEGAVRDNLAVYEMLRGG